MTAHRLVHAANAASRSYCLSQIRRYDHENFLAHLLQPKGPEQAVHLATRALNVELVNVRSMVSNEDLARLRIAFFRESFESTLNGFPPATPVFDMLGEAAEIVDLKPLYNLIDARGRELSYPSFDTIKQLEDHAESIHGSLIGVHTASAGGSEKLGRDVGVIVGLSILLRGVPAMAANRLSYIPKNVLEDLGLEVTDVIKGRMEGGSGCEAFKRVAESAENRMEDAMYGLRSSRKRVKSTLWPLFMAQEYLKRLRRVDYDPFDERLQRSLRATYPLRMQLRLLWARLTGL